MLTPQEVSERVFPKASFGGYNMSQVDAFLDELTEDYTALYKENTALKNKMKVLVEKVEEYRSTEDAMRMTLLTAQNMADTIVKEAEEKRNTLLQEAEDAVRAKVGNLKDAYAQEQYRLEQVQLQTANVVEQLRGLFNRELDFLDTLSDTIPPVLPSDEVQQTAQEIHESVGAIEDTTEIPDAQETQPLAPAMPKNTQRPAAKQDNQATRRLDEAEIEALLERLQSENAEEEFELEEQETEQIKRARIDFDNLAFGENYKA